MSIRAWFSQVSKIATIPFKVGRPDRNPLTVEDLEHKRRAIIDQGAADGKAISTERALKYVLELREKYDGPDRDQYIAQLDEVISEFRKKYGRQIPVAEAYATLKELENRLRE